ncbi:cobyric acid synthase [Amycolatopsis balhimycina DSM 5908]|uniref:Cobyric acid synthase n=1 Tax=Amycolatopsis balhimycina DSM 5908 TaxID=1081091 RepID=A0A428WYN0_AMYBA|nr:cobyric acid synthase [Amycolatopsis balhimycina]RSM48188.1 cobyric acid synthase [Amycolatopsis balhimycina DSM 5908]
MTGLLVAGTTSDAGKSLVTAGICRWLARRGVRVAPFKAQNMSNNSMVCADGAEIGRAQWVQARAAGVEPEAAMNPVLLKPGSDRRSHVVALGKPFGTLEAGEYATGRAGLAEIAFGAFEDLSARYDVVVCEGAGSPAEINLRGGDYVNMGLARRFGLPVVVVGDIDRGGVLAAMFGTLALLSAEDQALVAGWVVNKFRGDVGLLRPGLDSLEKVTGRPVLGVLPWLDRVWIDSEDALAAAGWRREAQNTGLDVAVVRFPRASNATDVDALAAEPGVTVTLTADPDRVAAADVVVLPGSRSTVGDLAWLRERGLDAAVTARAVTGRPVLGICGGYQMLAESIVDDVESGAGEVPGLGLLPAKVTFAAEKVLARPVGEWRGTRVDAYEIHHGSVTSATTTESFLDGMRAGAVWGTMWHGAFENDAFRRAWLTEAAAQAGVSWAPAPDAPGFGELREEMLDKLADAVGEHLDTAVLETLLERGAPPNLPFVPPGAP